MRDTLGAADFNLSESEAAPTKATDRTQHDAKIAQLNRISRNTKVLAGYDKRIHDEQQLSALYGQWIDLLTAQRRVALHAILRSLLWILLALIFLVLAEGLIERFYMGQGTDRRRLGTMRMVLRFISRSLACSLFS